MTSIVTCDHCGKVIGPYTAPYVRISVEPRGSPSFAATGAKSLKERAERLAQTATHNITGHSYDLHETCFNEQVLPHLIAAGLDRG
jgi:hypothetical protein